MGLLRFLLILVNAGIFFAYFYYSPLRRLKGRTVLKPLAEEDVSALLKNSKPVLCFCRSGFVNINNGVEPEEDRLRFVLRIFPLELSNSNFLQRCLQNAIGGKKSWLFALAPDEISYKQADLP